ncbi:hypothetical protein [uncultured Paraglaciecola sp.]|uniref:hypothetical protein n=1 Tax=uncultured Paraglaciecola sp. TaxID=1765024 RepID=UPI0030DBEF3F|tara:strand:- start:26684 stop:28732 length:2049 start_codon:yes stop_codon:yes gene_type:complete
MKYLKASIYISSTIALYPAASFGQEWNSAKQALVVKIETSVSTKQFRFLLNNNDVTSRFKQTGTSQFSYQGHGFDVPSGINTLIVYKVNSGQWQEIHNQEIKVLTSSGFETANWTVNGSVAVDAQLDTDYKGDAFKPEQNRFYVGNMQLSVDSQHTRKDLSIHSQANIVGTTKQENALRFYERGEQADKIDLSDYLVSVEKGKASFSVGHTGFGSNPLLVDNLSNRGVHLGYQFNSIFDIAFTQQNGSAIVGWNNFFGQQNSQHRIAASTLGAEMFPNEPGKLRIEMSYVDAQVQAIDDFAVGQVSDVEKNQGWGLRIISQLWEGRVRFDGVFASSRFTNPIDKALLSGDEFELVAVEQSTDQAYQVNLELDLLTQNEQGTRFFTASLNVGLDKTDALYRVIAAGPSADQKVARLGLRGELVSGQWQYAFTETENNIDRIPSILTSNTKSHSLNYNIELANAFLSETFELNHYLPSLNVNLQKVHQMAINMPATELSDFNADSHLPDQVTEILELSANWSLDTYTLGYNLSYSHQDNRQIGRQEADLSRVNHSINQSFQMFASLMLNLDLGRARNFDQENNTVFYNNNAALVMNYSLSSDWRINLGSSLNKDYDNFGLSTSNALTINIGLDHQWSYNLYGREVPGQWYLRYAKQRNESQDNIFAFNTFAQDWNITSGISLTF